LAARRTVVRIVALGLASWHDYGSESGEFL